MLSMVVSLLVFPVQSRRQGMTPKIQSALVEESSIVVTVRIPVDFGADHPVAHVENEGQIKEAARQVGRVASEKLFQEVANRHNEVEAYIENERRFRQENQTKLKFLSPYGHLEILRPWFYNDHTNTGLTPFERETRMEEHRITPMMQWQLLRKLAVLGPEACVADVDVEGILGFSHHLVDEYLEDMGRRYQALKPELTATVMEEGWRPAWYHPEPAPEEEDANEESQPAPPRNVLPFTSRGLEETCDEAPSDARVPVVQVDAMSVRERVYHERRANGKVDRRKYHIERHQMHNAVVGFVVPNGPRKPGEEIELEGKRFFSEYRDLDKLVGHVATYLEACGVKAGDRILRQADGDDTIWDTYDAHFGDYEPVDALDEQHARKNLKRMAESSYGKDARGRDRWVEKRMSDLYEGRYSSFFHGLDNLVRRTRDEEQREEVKTKRKYFQRHRKRIRYEELLAQGYPISTCFVESANRHVIGERLRNNGRSYRADRLQMIADFRCEYRSNRLPYVFERLLEMVA